MQSNSTNYEAFLELLQNGTLALVNGLEISSEACTLVEQIVDAAISKPFAPISKGRAIEMTNRAALLEGKIAYVHLLAPGGTFTLPACELRLVAFQEIAARNATAIETFAYFLQEYGWPHSYNYPKNLSAWGDIDARIVAKYRQWLDTHIPQAEHANKLEALALYCELATKAFLLEDEELEQILLTIEAPQPRPGRGSKTRKTRATR
jgi:hypothetical protein